MPLRLPSNPPAVRNLLNSALRRLEAQYDAKVMPRTPDHCLTCGGKKSFRWKDPNTGEVIDWECNCIEQYQLRLFLLNAGIEKQYQDLSLMDAHALEPDALALLADYFEYADAYVNQGLGLLLYGESGTGKTLISTLLLKHLLKKGYDGYFTPFSKMINSSVDGWYDQQERQWYIKRVVNAGVLVIDDIGHEPKARRETVLPIFNETLRARIAGARPTFITTNLSLSDLESYYRLGHLEKETYDFLSILRGCSIFLGFKGESYRNREGEEKRQNAREGLRRPAVME